MNKSIRIFLIGALVLAFAICASAQKKPAKAAPKADKIGQYVKNSGYKSETLDKGIWTLASYSGTVLIGSYEGILVVFMTVAEKGKFQITAESMSEMLRLANELDHVKFIIADDGNLLVRGEERIKYVDQAIFNDTVLRVTNGYDKATAKLAPFLVK